MRPSLLMLASAGLRGLTGALALLVAGVAGAQSAAQPPRPAARDRISDAALREQMAGSRPLRERLADKTKPVTAERPAPASSPYSQSIILFDGTAHTLVPQGAILHLPEALRGCIVDAPAGQFVLWTGFLKRNPAWLSAREVPLAMAQGDAPSSRRLLQELTSSQRVEVAVYRGNPISILEPVEPAAR